MAYSAEDSAKATGNADCLGFPGFLEFRGLGGISALQENGNSRMIGALFRSVWGCLGKGDFLSKDASAGLPYAGAKQGGFSACEMFHVSSSWG